MQAPEFASQVLAPCYYLCLKPLKEVRKVHEEDIYTFFVKLVEFNKKFLTQFKELYEEYPDLVKALRNPEELAKYLRRLPYEKQGRIFSAFITLAEISKKSRRLLELDEKELDNLLKEIENCIKVLKEVENDRHV